ncbi:MAG: OmpA family protein, partial [Rhodospirillaceae bacterium]|nr:OmpA family protein [Rhodospirillaceae bacterium]
LSGLQDGGKVELRKLATTLKELANRIPDDIDWILRVDGHTDARPFRGGSNLELSARRAIAVVNFLIAEGIPAGRLLAAGFGPHHPIDAGQTEEAYQKNRRIEIRLTQR